MQSLVEGTGFLGRMIRDAASYENAGEGRQKGDGGEKQRPAGTDAHHPPVSSVEGASSAAAPMRGRDRSALADSPGTRPPAIPIASAAVTAAIRKGRGKSCAPKFGLEIFSSIDASVAARRVGTASSDNRCSARSISIINTSPRYSASYARTPINPHFVCESAKTDNACFPARD